MKRIICLLFISLFLIGCTSETVKHNIYDEEWDGKTIVVEQIRENEERKVIHEITVESHVKNLIKALASADWQENVEIDIRPPDYTFTWNTYEHLLWVNEETNKLEVSIVGESNYGVLSEGNSNKVMEILLGNK